MSENPDNPVLVRLPYHLDLNAPPLARCNRCGRSTWTESAIGTEDRMSQPDGHPCGGRLVAL